MYVDDDEISNKKKREKGKEGMQRENSRIEREIEREEVSWITKMHKNTTQDNERQGIPFCVLYSLKREVDDRMYSLVSAAGHHHYHHLPVDTFPFILIFSASSAKGLYSSL